MAAKNVTPKKLYSKQSGKKSSCCRLCLNVCDAYHCKNIFHRNNNNIKLIAEELCDVTIKKEELFPDILCRPCERRLINFQSYKELVKRNQESLVQKSRAKRITEVSPSVLKAPKALKTGQVLGKSRRNLNFDKEVRLLISSDFNTII